MQITNVKCPQEKYSIKCPYEMKPEYITIHNTANDASAMAEVSYMIGNNNKVSFHVAVDNYRVVTGLPFSRNGWHAGDGRGNGNMKSIGIEICYSKSGGQRFKEAEELCAEYVAYLLKQYGWGLDRVKKHQDWSKKYCPHRTLDMGWNRFLDLIRKYMNIQPVDNSDVKKGSDETVRTYCNGSTRENVFSDTSLTNKIGSLNPYEKCDCFGIYNNRAMVRYRVGNTKNYKIGFAKWTGGVR